jgi:predicted kinase
MNKIIFMRGAPASGKSTWAKQYISSNPKVKRVSRDEIREQLDFYSTVGNYENEKLVSEIERENILSLLKKGYDVIIDATLTQTKYLKDYFKLFVNTGFNLEFELKTFNTTLEQCIERNFARAEQGGRNVPKDVIQKMHSCIVSNTRSFENDFAGLVEEYKENFALKNIYKNLDLEPCYVFDIDGTLAHMNGRGPFDWSRVGEDKENRDVAMISSELYISNLNKRVFIMSGRDEICRPETEKWLSGHGIFHHGLFMVTKNM